MIKQNIYFIALSFLFLLSCRNKTENSFPNLNTDPLVERLKQNNISYYLKTKMWKDTIVGIDSIKLNSDGYITYKRGWETQRFVYDSINRIIEEEYHSDIHYHIKNIRYRLDRKKNQVQKNSENSILQVYNFDKSYKHLLNSFVIESKDTVKHISYFYKNGKISKVSEDYILEKYIQNKVYLYDKNNKLKTIIENGETEYISPKTGLIDSSLRMGHISYYKYFKRK